MAPDIDMVASGVGSFVRADRIIAVLPIEEGERGVDRRTYVHLEGLAVPVTASRSEGAILADLQRIAEESRESLPDADPIPRGDGARPSFGRQRRLPRR
jgi:hypothetical protein